MLMVDMAVFITIRIDKVIKMALHNNGDSDVDNVDGIDNCDS